MLKIFLVLLGGAVGTGFRFGVSTFIYSRIERPTFPYATFLINITGSFLIGFLAEYFDARGLGTSVARATLIIGVLGGYTTFSSFSLESFALLRQGELMRALINALGSVLLGLVAVWAGVRIAQRW